MTPSEKAKKLGVPLIPPLPIPKPQAGMPTEPNPIVSVCGECGIECRKMMWYSCQKPHCPVGLGMAVSASTECEICADTGTAFGKLCVCKS